MWSHPSRSSIPHRCVANAAFPELEKRVASLTDSRLLQQFRAAADRDSMANDEWLQRIETAMRALPDHQRLHSVLPRLQHYQQTENLLRGAGGENRP